VTRYEEWSGETWFLNSGHAQAQHSIQVIESVPKSAKKGKKGANPKKVPFGFARELPKQKKRKG
jgi:hypothetical protein